MSDHYILKGKKAVPTDLMTWARWLEGDFKKRQVANTREGDIRVSTVFLGLDHAFDGGKPEIFETKIFGGEHDQDMWRYSTWEEAEAGHAEACKLAGVALDKRNA